MGNPRFDIQFHKDIAQKLRDLRTERKLSQMRVTMDTGINVSRAESGKRALSAYSIAILCEYYNISLEEFFQGMRISVAPWK